MCERKRLIPGKEERRRGSRGGAPYEGAGGLRDAGRRQDPEGDSLPRTTSVVITVVITLL